MFLGQQVMQKLVGQTRHLFRWLDQLVTEIKTGLGKIHCSEPLQASGAMEIASCLL